MERQGIRENPIRRNEYALQGGASGEAQQIKQAIAQLQDQQQNATSVQRTMNDRAIEHLTKQLEHLEGGAMSGGAHPTQPLEFSLASRRAMEEHHNRTNPHRSGATPTMGVSRVRGGRAVPSSGLSQFRGGSNGVIVGGGMGSDSEESDDECEGGARDMEIMARESGRRPAIRSGQSDKHSQEAKEMGRHLGRHLMTMRGGGFFDLFTKGILEASRQGESVAKFTGLPNSSPPPIPDANASAGPDTGAAPPPTGGSAMFYRHGDMSKDVEEHHEEHTARRFGRTHRGAGIFNNINAVSNHPMRQYELPTTDMGLKPIGLIQKPTHDFMLPKPYMPSSDRTPTKDFKFGDMKGFKLPTYSKPSTPTDRATVVASIPKPRKGGVNPRTEGLTDEQIRMADYLKDIPTLRKGGFKSGAYEGMGKLTIIHGGARAARAAIVKKVMAEQGCSMPEASKYVKEHGLYKGGASCGGTRSETKPKRKEKNPYGRTRTSEMSLGKMKKVKKPAQAPPPAEQPDVGLSLDLPPPPVGRGKGRRAPAGPNDGRRARAAIVKKVMAEQGFKSMIEASKYVKDHNLY
jgi:hypothetical protein